MKTQNLVISFDYSWFFAKNLAYAECPIMKFHYRNSSRFHAQLDQKIREGIWCWVQSTKNILYSLDQFKHLQQEHCTLLCILIERSFSIQKIVFFVSSGDQIKGAFTKYDEKSLTIYVPTFFNTF